MTNTASYEQVRLPPNSLRFGPENRTENASKMATKFGRHLPIALTRKSFKVKHLYVGTGP
jgi:hypothetical protein